MPQIMNKLCMRYNGKIIKKSFNKAYKKHEEKLEKSCDL